MSEEKKPALFSEFFDSMVEKLRNSKKSREDEAIRRTLITDDRVLKLQDDIARARETKKFLTSGFWINYLHPYLRAESILKPAVLREGEPAPNKRMFVEFLIGSGKVHVLSRMVASFDDWIKKGQEAENILKAESEKRSALRGVA